MSAIRDMNACSFASEELLPLRAESGEALPAEARNHLETCGECARVWSQRSEIAAELRSLPRLSTPGGSQSALQFAAILERLDEGKLDTRLADEEVEVRGLLRSLERLPTPATLELPTEIFGAPILQLRPAASRVAALAAAAALVAAVGLTFAGRAPARGGLAAQTAQLTAEALREGRAPIPVEVVVVDPRTAEGARLRSSLDSPLARRGGP
jgi:hypothetical protein